MFKYKISSLKNTQLCPALTSAIVLRVGSVFLSHSALCKYPAGITFLTVQFY